MSRPFCCLSVALLSLLFTFSTAYAQAPAAPRTDCEGDIWISLEITAGEVAGNREAEWVEIDRSGCVISRYAPWDRRAGTWQGQLSANQQQSLQQQVAHFEASGFDSIEVRAEIEAKAKQKAAMTGMDQGFYIADADQWRLEIRSGKTRQLIEWKSPAIEFELREEAKALAPLVEMLAAVRAAGELTRQQAKAQVRP